MPRQGVLRIAGLTAVGLVVVLVAGFYILDWCFPFPVERVFPPSSVRVVDRDGVELRRFTAADSMWRFPVAVKDVSPQLIDALVASEDRWFHVHPGVNPLAIVRAAWTNVRAGRIVSGASTIPMQIARLAEPKARTLSSKLVEAFRALQLSKQYSKVELLAIYLNTAPFGGNIMGVEAAARIYFDKPASQLSLGECALLAVLPRAPNRYSPVRHPKAALAVRDRVLNQLAKAGVVPMGEAQRAKRQPMVAKRRSSPMLAPHFALLAKHRLGEKFELRTSLSMGKQRVVERLLAAHVQRVREQGLSNGAVVVMDRATRQILALAGSADFFDDVAQGQVNNALSLRSPGSTLKPFLYALAFEKGVAIPESRLLDVPTDYAGYKPENYSGTWSGSVTAKQALSHSLNVPAVRLLAKTGLREYYDLLRAGGLRTLDRPAATYGLPLALGACEVRLIDLVNLYASLAEGGVFLPWRVTVGRQSGAARRLFSEEAARLTSSILTEVVRPDMPDTWRLTRGRPVVAWKTGTSFGHRDAWAVGFGPQFAVGVWVGNPDGTPVKGISGATHAGPLFFDVVQSLETSSRDLGMPQAPGLREVDLCALSHQLAGPNCPHTIRALAVSSLHIPRCTDHQRIMVDVETGHRLEGACLLTRPARAEIVVVYPPELAAWMASQGMPVPQLPRLSPACLDVPAGVGPQIVSPSATTLYVLQPDMPQNYQRVSLVAQTSRPGERLWWYVDNRFAGVSSGDEPLFYPLEPGRHQVSVSDGQGRTDSLEYRVAH